VIAPAVSHAATGDSSALDERVASLEGVLAALVTEGAINQQQAGTTLAELAEQQGVDEDALVDALIEEEKTTPPRP
jgi:hypothetical protein